MAGTNARRTNYFRQGGKHHVKGKGGYKGGGIFTPKQTKRLRKKGNQAIKRRTR